MSDQNMPTDFLDGFVLLAFVCICSHYRFHSESLFNCSCNVWILDL